MFKRLRNDKRAVSGIILGLVVVLVMLAVILPISLYTVVKIKGSIDALPIFTKYSAEYNASSAPYNASKALYDNVFSAYNIASITPLIAVASVIVAMVVVGFAIKRGI